MKVIDKIFIIRILIEMQIETKEALLTEVDRCHIEPVTVLEGVINEFEKK